MELVRIENFYMLFLYVLLLIDEIWLRCNFVHSMRDDEIVRHFVLLGWLLQNVSSNYQLSILISFFVTGLFKMLQKC